MKEADKQSAEQNAACTYRFIVTGREAGREDSWGPLSDFSVAKRVPRASERGASRIPTKAG